jgi:hypothetical protein
MGDPGLVDGLHQVAGEPAQADPSSRLDDLLTLFVGQLAVEAC